MTKQELRKLYRQKRLELQDRQQVVNDDLLLIQFQQMSIFDISSLLSYFPIAGKKEPNVLNITNYFRYMIPHLTISYPVSDALSRNMKALAVNEDTVYRSGAFQILEPKEGDEVPPEAIDMVLVPLLAFDKRGYRVGYGKGYYDLFLSKCRSDVLKIGCSYFPPVPFISDIDKYDIPLTHCVTPQVVYEF
jgi:5-formyltetrahydrofolate cyclo-ligase